MLQFYTISEQFKKEIKQNNSIYNSIKKNKMLRNKFIQEGEKISIQNVAEKN